jgi:Flagellar biosynthesis protein, FliO
MPDLTPYLGVLAIVGIALAALILCVIIYKLFSSRVRGRRGSRLGISEFHELDKSRRLVLIRRDDTEHLILIGGSQELVIETNIESGLNMRSKVTNEMLASDPIPMRPPPRPAVFGDRVQPLRPVSTTRRMDEDETA